MTLALDKFTISGTITDAETGEKLSGVNVYIKGTSIGTTSNNDGFYSLTLPITSYRITYRYIGYKTFEKEFALTKNMSSNINMLPVTLEGEKVAFQLDLVESHVI